MDLLILLKVSTFKNKLLLSFALMLDIVILLSKFEMTHITNTTGKNLWLSFIKQNNSRFLVF